MNDLFKNIISVTRKRYYVNRYLIYFAVAADDVDDGEMDTDLNQMKLWTVSVRGMFLLFSLSFFFFFFFSLV